MLGKQSRSYRANLAALGLPRLDDRRVHLMRSFAISAYRSVHHRWWFSPNKQSLSKTRSALPRFCVPLLKLRRSENRPFQKYAELLNSISPDEWMRLRLDQICHERSRPNVQLQDLVEPLLSGVAPLPQAVHDQGVVLLDPVALVQSDESSAGSMSDPVEYAVPPFPLFNSTI